jgi:hypothetical protein
MQLDLTETSRLDDLLPNPTACQESLAAAPFTQPERSS